MSLIIRLVNPGLRTGTGMDPELSRGTPTPIHLLCGSISNALPIVSSATAMLLAISLRLGSAAQRSASRTPILSGNATVYSSQARGIISAAAAEQPAADHPQTSIGIPSVKRASRREAIKQAKPFSDFLTDNFSRQHDYLRISITERCNLRCLYCMPEEGVPLSPPNHLLTSPEIFYISSLFVSQGVTKIRLTGGEPTVRRDILPLMRSIGSLRSNGLRELAITTNGISLHRKLDSMVESGLTGVNLSLDTLDPFQFQIMTRRKGFDAVMKSIDRILEMKKLGAPVKLKINCVVMRGLNDKDIVPFVELGREKDIEVRFIEYMPFDGNKWSQGKMLPYAEMIDIIRAKYPDLRRVKGHKNDTSKTWEIPGFVGKIGFITSMTENFCGTCNRLRITSDGNLKVCLFGNAEVSLRDLLRKDNEGRPINEEAFEAIKKIEMDSQEGLPGDGTGPGWGEREQELLEVIGAAVKRKKEKHAGMGELENMKNRPMILIGGTFTTSFQYRASRASHQPWKSVPAHLLHPSGPSHSSLTRPVQPELTHVDSKGEANMVSVTNKESTHRMAMAVCSVYFSEPTTYHLIAQNRVKKGDVLSTARIAGIMAAKNTPLLIPLCHSLPLSNIEVNVMLINPDPQSRDQDSSVRIEAVVECHGPTGVEMEALTAANVAALTVYDMCKAVDKHMDISGGRVVLKSGGKSGLWWNSDRTDVYARPGTDVSDLLLKWSNQSSASASALEYAEAPWILEEWAKVLVERQRNKEMKGEVDNDEDPITLRPPVHVQLLEAMIMRLWQDGYDVGPLEKWRGRLLSKEERKKKEQTKEEEQKIGGVSDGEEGREKEEQKKKEEQEKPKMKKLGGWPNWAG
ncbi:molybdenum cofactor biosynthesis prote [Saccharata proteae CBS 121410]|uniref:Molybdenum cofactor biosynthesis prote n=1 Tax=Saccharata proteae CBS 121410 TaxID=1314787 RepID=A0A9P4HUW9_9PEZI|nr:molybdenum cofactor biosynthesis prote [Saccharata proteae CBS 121410]